VATSAGATVVPARISGSRNLAEAFRRRRRLVVRYGHPIEPPADGDYRAMADRIMSAIGRLSEGAVEA
jgi:1-acyl-sn-glycerol-3-phosphate acyltransferase